MTRTSILLGVVATALLAFILVFERGTVSTGEREQRKGRVLERFVRDRLTRLELQRKGISTVLTRGPDEANQLELGAWRVEAPYEAAADSIAVDTLIGELEWLQARRTLYEVSDEDRARFGLDKPRYRLRFTVGREQGLLVVGKETPQGDGTYVQAGDPKVAFIVGKDLVEALDHAPEHFHTKELHEGVSIYGAQKVRFADESGERVVEKVDDVFWLRKPEVGLASEPDVGEALSALDGLKATRYVAAASVALERYGLDAPRFVMAVESKSFDGKKKDDYRLVELRLAVGKSCEGYEGESYVRVDAGPIVCAADASLAKLNKSASELEERRLLMLSDTKIEGVRITSDDVELVLAKKDGEWSYEKSVGGKKVASGTADANAVSEWWKLLRAARADSIAPQKVSALRDDASVRVRFDRGKDEPAYELGFGRNEAGRVAVTRSGEQAIVWFPQAVAELVSPSTARFRPSKLLSEDASTWRRLRLSRGGTVETVTRDGKDYRFEAPVPAPVDRRVVDEIVRLTAALSAVRFVADAPEPSHGLAAPALTLELELATDGDKRKTHVLHLGERTDGGRYARLEGDPGVFVAPEALVRELEQPLVSRMALSTSLERLLGLELEARGRKVQVEKRGSGFVLSSDSSSARGEELARALASLRAQEVKGYHSSRPEEGLSSPRARLTVRARGEAEAETRYTLLIGAPAGEGENAPLFARRTDLDVSFTLAREDVEALLAAVR